MTKNLVRFFCFWIIFGLLFTPINLAMRAGSKQWNDFYHLQKNSVDVIFLGNSHNFVSFQPKIIDSIIPINSYVIGINSENIIISYYELKEILKYQHPKIVVLETFVLDLDDSRAKKFIFEFLDTGKWSLNKSAIGKRYLTPESIYTVFPALRLRMTWDKPVDYFKKLADEIKNSSSPQIDPRRGNLENPRVIPDSEYIAAEESPEWEYLKPDSDVQTYLEKIDQLCKDNKIQLILTTAPMIKSTQNQADYYAPFDETPFVKANNISLVSYDLSGLNRLHYANAGHVNAFGSQIVSIDMAMQLSKIMQLPVDEKALAYFQSYIFSDYALVPEGNNYTITLNPQNEKAPLEYKWVLIETATGRQVQSSDWNSKSSFRFTKEQEGEYNLNVEIRNLDGDYVLSAFFPITFKD